MSRRKHADVPRWQDQAKLISVGDIVRVCPGSETDVGRVLAVYPGIGMADVQFPQGAIRFPVEDLQVYRAEDAPFVALDVDSVPGGAGTAALVSTGGPPRMAKKVTPSNLAKTYLKKALYWAEKDRHYRVSESEHHDRKLRCPKRGCGGELKRAVYKRQDGRSERLLGCPSCMFLIRQEDIVNWE